VRTTAAEASVVLPERVVVALLQFGLRTEPGKAYWDGFTATLLEQHPWLAGPLAFRPGHGEVVPHPAPQNGKA
jgi:hypothetical protein